MSSHKRFPEVVIQWYWPATNTVWSYKRVSPALFLCPHFPTKCEYPSYPHLAQYLARWELSSFILKKEWHESGRVFVWPLKYWTTASPELLAAVVTWNVRPCCLLQWNLIWVKDKCLLSSFMALIVIPILWFMNLLIPRYDGSAVQAGGMVELSTIKLDVRSQPPSNVK